MQRLKGCIVVSPSTRERYNKLKVSNILSQTGFQNKPCSYPLTEPKNVSMSIQGKCEDGTTFPTNVGEGRMGDQSCRIKARSLWLEVLQSTCLNDVVMFIWLAERGTLSYIYILNRMFIKQMILKRNSTAHEC